MRAVPIRAISFDLFDTLVDLHLDTLPEIELDGTRWRGTHLEIHRAIRELAPLVELEPLLRALAAVDRDLRRPREVEGRELPTLERFTELAARLGLREPGLPERLTEAHMGMLESCAHTPQHHAGVLADLATRAPLALCSNFSHAPTARRILQAAGLGGLLGPLLISDEVGFRKPRSEIFRAVLEALDCEPGDVLHVGDRLDADVGGAAALGLRTAWLTRRVPDPLAQRAAYSGPSPDWIVSDLSELRALLDAS